MMLLHFYLFVNAYTQEAHEGVLHEAFDHGATVEPLENHETQHEHDNHGQDVYNYDGEMHNELHELVHDGSNFVIEDHVEDHPAWNFMEDANKAAEENMAYPTHQSTTGMSGGTTMQANTGSAPQASRAAAGFRSPAQRFNNSPATTFSNNSMTRPTSNTRFINPNSNTGTGFNMNMGTMTNQGSLSNPTNNMFQSRPQSPTPTAGGLGCTTDPAKATAMANQLIGMLFRSSQMMSEIVNMFNTPNPRSTGSTRPTGSTFAQPNSAARFTAPTTGFTMNPMTSAATMTPSASSGTQNQNTYSYGR